MNGTMIRFLAATVLASAASAATPSERAFAHADKNGDVRISFEEYRNQAVHVFHDLDHDGNHRISGDEHPPSTGPAGESTFPDDISIHDFHVALRGYFDAADRDRDGALDLNEWLGKPATAQGDTP